MPVAAEWDALGSDVLPSVVALSVANSCQRVFALAVDWTVRTVLEATQGQIDSFFSQLSYKYHLEEVASMGD